MARIQRGAKRYMNPSITTLSARFAASEIASISASDNASGFSQRTCLPACKALIAHSA